MTRRDNGGGLWTGDVWKIIPILKQYRPDLRIFNLDAGPTGLVCCTNVDPKSQVIENSYGKIWDDWRKVELQDYGFDKLIDLASIIWTEDLASPEDMRRYFWL